MRVVVGQISLVVKVVRSNVFARRVARCEYDLLRSGWLMMDAIIRYLIPQVVSTVDVFERVAIAKDQNAV